MESIASMNWKSKHLLHRYVGGAITTREHTETTPGATEACFVVKNALVASTEIAV